MLLVFFFFRFVFAVKDILSKRYFILSIKSVFNLYFFRDFHSKQEIEIALKTDGCKGQPNEIRYLEHAQLTLTMEYSKRGDLSINITSAMSKS